MAAIRELRQRWEMLAQVGLEKNLDLILVYFDEYNMADACYLTNIWTQFERGLVAIAVDSAEPCLLVGPETANFVMTHMPELESRVISLFLAWGRRLSEHANGKTQPRRWRIWRGSSRVGLGLVGSGFLPLDALSVLIVDG